MPWPIALVDAFAAEVAAISPEVRIELLAHALLLEEFGPRLGRPHADTLKGSKHANMKELRFQASDGVWRVAFAFDPRRTGVLLVAGDKSGVSERRFYRRLIAAADARYDEHLAEIRNRKGE
jgi:hypothetical protein